MRLERIHVIARGTGHLKRFIIFGCRPEFSIDFKNPIGWVHVKMGGYSGLTR